MTEAEVRRCGEEGKDDGAKATVERKIEEALACDCIADLKEGPCGAPFVEAFSCFIRSQHLEVGTPSSLRPSETK